MIDETFDISGVFLYTTFAFAEGYIAVCSRRDGRVSRHNMGGYSTSAVIDMDNLTRLKKEMHAVADPEQAKNALRFFKTCKGEYGQGDRFLGLKVPVVRAVAKAYDDLSLADCVALLQSHWHEFRQVATFIMVLQFTKGDEKKRERIYKAYLANTRRINNWDLVDMSAPQIVGGYLQDKNRDALYRFARSKNLWERRISILATFAFIRDNDFGDTLKLAKILLHDEHDLMHKAVGWMLREVGNRDKGVEELFLKKWYKHMPRTMLRYAIERFPEVRRRQYLDGRV